MQNHLGCIPNKYGIMRNDNGFNENKSGTTTTSESFGRTWQLLGMIA